MFFCLPLVTGNRAPQPPSFSSENRVLSSFPRRTWILGALQSAQMVSSTRVSRMLTVEREVDVVDAVLEWPVNRVLIVFLLCHAVQSELV
jgi:hypothetical protein